MFTTESTTLRNLGNAILVWIFYCSDFHSKGYFSSVFYLGSHTYIYAFVCCANQHTSNAKYNALLIAPFQIDFLKSIIQLLVLFVNYPANVGKKAGVNIERAKQAERMFCVFYVLCSFVELIHRSYTYSNFLLIDVL